MKNNNKMLYISIAILVLVIGIAIGTYAYYQTTISGTISGSVAKWSFTANGQTSSFNLDLGDLYPGKSGTYNLELSAEDSDLDVYYEMFINSNLVIPNVKGNLFWDSANTKRVQNCNGYDGGHPGVYGTIPAGEKVNISLYFNWPYDGRDNYRTGNDNFEVTIVGQQLTGYTGTTPMKLLSDSVIDALYLVDVDYADGYISAICPREE